MSHQAYNIYVRESSSALAVCRSCRLCKFGVSLRLGVPNVGRGNGMREGNKQRGILIQHLKSEHPAEYAQAMGLQHLQILQDRARVSHNGRRPALMEKDR